MLLYPRKGGWRPIIPDAFSPCSKVESRPKNSSSYAKTSEFSGETSEGTPQLAGRLSCEMSLDFFQRLALGLGQQEGHSEEIDDRESGKQKEHG